MDIIDGILITLGVITGIFLIISSTYFLISGHDDLVWGIIGIIFGILILIICIRHLKEETSNPPYRFKPIPKPKTIDTLYYNVEVKNDSIITTLKTYKTK